jgi:hypothetical protein
MAVNKVIYGGNTLIDLSEDTVTPETLAEGVTAHDKSGAIIVGTMASGDDTGTLGSTLIKLMEGTVTAVDGLDGLSTIRDYGFYSYKSLKKVHIPSSVKTIGSFAFGSCTYATEVLMEYGVTAIGERAFANMNDLKTANLPDSIETIGSYAFHNDGNLTINGLPKNLKSVGDGAFYNVDVVADSLPDNIQTIGNNTFRNNGYLTFTHIPASMQTIGTYAFASCSGLTSLTFNGTPKSIASTTFNSNTNLKTINVPWAEGAVANAPWGATNATINYNYTGE